MADSTNLYQDIKNALGQFQSFLSNNRDAIKGAVKALKAIAPQIGDLLTKLFNLMESLKQAIQNLNVGQIPGLAQVTQFTQNVQTLATAASALLPASQVSDVQSAANVIGSLPSFDALKNDILALIKQIEDDLTFINS
jgi:ABC-type transporter Mla subunit MlaD